MTSIMTYCSSLENDININFILREKTLYSLVTKNNKIILNNKQELDRSFNTFNPSMVEAIDIAYANIINALGYKHYNVIKRYYTYQPITFDVRLDVIIVKTDGVFELYIKRDDITTYKRVATIRQVVKILKGLSKPVKNSIFGADL